jgi:hypothetical protein
MLLAQRRNDERNTMSDTITEAWGQVRDTLADADSIAWDGCHKIYVLMDKDQTAEMVSYGYDPLLPVTDPSVALDTLCGWYEESCGLRFIEAVKTVPRGENRNGGFTRLIGQFEFDEDGNRATDEDEEN